MDPGFELNVRSGRTGAATDVAEEILEACVLRAKLSVKDNELNLRVFRRGRIEAVPADRRHVRQ